MIKRTVERKLKEASISYPVIAITGPRQSGKTTLARKVFPDYRYLSLEEPDQAHIAQEDPRGFLSQSTDPMILDEVQRVPKLLSYIQTIVDLDNRPGRFVLTGSHNFLLMEGISQSLAGRCAIFYLLPFSQAELRGREPIDIEQLDTPKTLTVPEKKGDLYEMLFAGFYPRIHDRGLDPQEWLGDYLSTYVERDVRLISNIGDAQTFRRFLGLCAARSGQLLNLSSLARDCGITVVTARKWLSILETSFLIKLLTPHYENFNKRLIKTPKLYFIDTGLLCYLLKIRSPDELQKSGLRGQVFETWVVEEFIKNCCHRKREPDFYYWRDSNGHEVDLVVSRGTALLPISVKSGQTFSEDFIKELLFWRRLTGCDEHPGVVIYGGDQFFEYKGFTVVPWYML
ncbi:MAG TPA: ATP-binding protein [Anaerohalosphaeraceae bacterium]|mgnify:CR=1 FL=1|nr:ATP-binding protein [Anaerohalosphaeraceae bacterium]HOL88544.1 ATP-binding protein [Anaerohalosphaeraceae bacterium]HPP56402.1 ATP-binding protein [Anaerohalosphaeraceae bacterium]